MRLYVSMQPRGVRHITGAPLLRRVPILEGEVDVWAADCGDNCADDEAGAVRGRAAAPAERELQGEVR
jgi:hypothetical protein